MARKSAVLTPEGKKEALAQLSNTLKDAKVVVKQAQEKQKTLENVKARSTKDYVRFQKAQDAAIAKAKKEVDRATGKLEVATKAVAELKAQEAVKPPKPAKAPEIKPLIQASAATTVQ
jgi:DNA repair exonuclease SbcCD ATPase subunit